MTSASCKSFSIASKLVDKLLSVPVSAKQLSLLTTLIGNELKEVRDQQTSDWEARPLTTPNTVVDPPPQLACIQLDGGRIQTRTEGIGHGVFDPHWRETKNAGFHRMATQTFESDPHPELPSCFSTRKRMSQLLVGLEKAEEKAAGKAEKGTVDSPAEAEAETEAKPDFSWRPKPLFRSCLASMCSSDEFGPMMAAEADRRGFFTAHRRAFLGDGLNYNWTIHEKHFSSFVPILDFIHPIERLHKVSRALESDDEAAWEQTVVWIEDCWKGQVKEVIGVLLMKQMVLGLPQQGAGPEDQRRILQETIQYLEHNEQRMDYPTYRQQGLPITSCLIESQVKEINHRVKGSEKFWNDGDEAEAILQVKAAIIGDEDRLALHFQGRKGSPYDRISKPK